MIKRYGIGIVALITAMSMAAYTVPNRSHLNATHVFEFDGTIPGGYSVPNVQNTSPTNWKYVGEIGDEELCEGEDKACRIAVSDTYFDNTSSPVSLSGGLSISASMGGSGYAVITGITAPLENQYSNQEAGD
ncbi:MAG TPA: hypothetical protein PKV73_02945 [Agriterribacter sp.]|nr:hypothetical protein [Agriterribacter sp.]